MNDDDFPPIIVRTSARQRSTKSSSAFAAGFHGTLGVLVALLIVFMVVPAVITSCFLIMSTGLGVGARAVEERLERQREQEVRQQRVDRENAAARAHEAKARERDHVRQTRAKHAQPRDWRDQRGSILCRGTYLESNDTAVTIQLNASEMVSITISELSEEDKDYIDRMVD